MLPSKMKINKNLLPIKGHFLFFNAGTAPLVPYLSTYARQLGFTSATVGLIYTVLPIFGLIAKPLFGVIADRFKIQKQLFILFQIVTIVSFSAIYFVPETPSKVAVDLDCGDGVTVLRSCYSSVDEVDSCKVNTLGDESLLTAKCDMNCDMSSPKMWQTVCEHWHIPQYCYSNTDSISYSSHLSESLTRYKCFYIAAANVTLDGFSYTPKCRIGDGYVDIDEPCNLSCSDPRTSALVGERAVNMTCLDKTLHFRVGCSNETVAAWEDGKLNAECETKCALNPSTPWRLMEICEGWGADAAASCAPRDDTLPANLSFVGTVKLDTVISEHECVFVQLHEIQLTDADGMLGNIHYPTCVSRAQYQTDEGLFHTSCNITCDNTMLNELFQSASDSTGEEPNQYTKQFWLFFLLMILSWIGQAVVVTIADAICFDILGDKPANYGKQRLWGSFGYGIFSLLTGTLIDALSDGAVKDYTVAFVLMFVFMSGDVVVSCFLKNGSSKMSLNILADVGTLLSSLPTVVFFLWTIAVGLCTGLLWQFLFWHLEDISSMTCDGADYIKTLQGLVSAVQMFGGEIPFMFLSGFILKKFGHVNMMSLVLFAFGVRFILYSFLTNAWWVLPIELLQGITFGMFYPTMTSYANVVSAPGTENTVQGLTGAIFEGVGTSLGSFIGGTLYETYGGWNTFRWFGIASLIFGLIHMAGQYLLKDKIAHAGLPQGYSSVIRYEQPNDTVFILDDEQEDNTD